MKRIRVFLFLSLVLTSMRLSQAQFLSGQNTENSTLIFNGSAIGFKPVKDGEIAFSYVKNPLRSCGSGQSSPPLFTGIFLNAKNQEGIGGLFSEGQFQPSARALGVFGMRINLIPNYDQLECAYIQSRLPLLPANQNLGKTIIKFITDELTNKIADLKRREFLTRQLTKIITDNPVVDWKTKLNAFAKEAPDEVPRNRRTPAPQPPPANKPASGEAVIIKEIAVGVQSRIEADDDLRAGLRQDSIAAETAFNAVKDKPVRELKLYFLLRQRADQFYTLESISNTAPFSSFTKRYYGRTEWGFGANLTLGGRLVLGASYGERMANNLGSLTKGEYTLTNTVIQGTQKIVEEKKRTAYLGTYQEFKQSFFYVDLLYFSQTIHNQNNDSTVNILLNPYFRYDASRQKEIYPDVSTLGLTMLYRSKKRFIGGLYVEAFDVPNNLEPYNANLPGRTADLIPLHNRLSFGIITQFELLSILKP